jgi:predicted amidohydrolase YtcJ
MSDPRQMLKDLTACDAAGLQLIVHAIGDRANHQVLSFFEQIADRNGRRDRRCRIEHAQHVQASDFKKFAETGVIASVQPYHASDDGRWADGRIGTERARHAYAFRSFLEAGVTLALGSDWWVAPINPMETIWAATTRATLDGTRPGGWVPEQKISVREAVHGYTVGAAYASGEENVKGSLERGKLADLAVLSEDIFDIEAERIREVQVDYTVFDGRVIYERA